MNAVKKSANISSDILGQIDAYITANPGVSFTLIINQALKSWLNKPEISIRLSDKKISEDELRKFEQDNKDLLKSLAK